MHQQDDAIFLVLPPEARYLHSVRLVVADAGRRAGFTVSEIDDLKIVVGELAQTVMAATTHRIALQVRVDGRLVFVRGTARRRRSDAPPKLAPVPALIVDAVSDAHTLSFSGTEMWFELTKRATNGAMT